MEKTLIFGHQKPDTDAVTSAIVLSYLRNSLGDDTEPRVLGSISRETEFVLKYFGFDAPDYLNDVRLQIKDIDYSTGYYLNEKDSVFDGYNYMRNTKIGIIPIVNDEGKYVGTVSMKDIAGDLINSELGNLKTSYSNLIKVLNGSEIFNFSKDINGKIIVSSLSSDSFVKKVKLDETSVMVVGDRRKIIEYAIDSKVALLILTNSTVLDDELMKKAKSNKINIIVTDYDTITTANLVILSNYLKEKMMTENVVTVNENDSLYEVLETANRKKYANYPVLDNEGYCLGLFRANITNNKHPKKVILVDHNEMEQSVVGLDEAEIVEVVDHHKIGNIGTSMPINFRNMPLGCTETILYLMFREKRVEIPKNIAGLMMSGIISDTLLLTSPTTTDIDKRALKKLSKIAEVDYEEYAMKMFKAGSSIEGKSISEVIHGDFKNFSVDNQRLGIGQMSTMTTDDIMLKKDEFVSKLDELAEDEDYTAVALFVTDILKNGSYILFNQKSAEIFAESFGLESIEEGQFFEGIVSRKKQIVPKIMNYMDNR